MPVGEPLKRVDTDSLALITVHLGGVIFPDHRSIEFNLFARDADDLLVYGDRDDREVDTTGDGIPTALPVDVITTDRPCGDPAYYPTARTIPTASPLGDPDLTAGDYDVLDDNPRLTDTDDHDIHDDPADIIDRQ